MKLTNNDKINEKHLSRKAVIYIRQSSERQVREHNESSQLQYALKERVISLGWKSVVVIDEDMGKSGAYYSERSGFQRLVTQVSMGEVGIVMSLEATRLARNNRDWYHLMDICTIFDTLIGDHQSVYDPKDPNDRLLLGVKGTMSEAELNIIKFRMRQGRLSKARRGALYSILPCGYIIGKGELVEKSPNIREQQAIELIFKKFKELGSARQTHIWLIQERVLVPIKCKGRDIEGRESRWQFPNARFILDVLRNPFYAGAYAYGRRETRIYYKNGQLKKTCGYWKKREDWEVLIKDHHEGYISWEEYEENLLVLRNNSNYHKGGGEIVGAIRRGKGLLVGLLRCQRCGRKMHVRYWGKNGIVGRYVCEGEFNHGGDYCQSFSAIKTDSVFEEELFKAVKPAAIQASIKASEVLNQNNDAKIKRLELEYENGQYESNRAYHQYNQVDPLNRLVASELERRWNEKLEALNEIKDRIANEKEKLRKPTHKEIEQLKSLPARFPEVWRHAKADPVVKKRIIRMVVEEVLIRLDDDKPLLTMTIRWKGGVHTQLKFKKPTKGDAPPNKTDANVLELLKNLSPHLPDKEIAKVFNCHKLKTGVGNPWNRSRVRSLRSENNIPPFDRSKQKDIVNLSEAANQLNLSVHNIRAFINKGIIKATQIIKFAPWQIKRSELDKETVKETAKKLKQEGSIKFLKEVNPNQLNLFPQNQACGGEVYYG